MPHLTTQERALHKLNDLYQSGILCEEGFDILSGHEKLSEIVDSLSMLHLADLLSIQNINTLVAHIKLKYVCSSRYARALISLQEAGLLNQARFDQITEHVAPDDLCMMILILGRAKALTPLTFEPIKKQAASLTSRGIIYHLADTGLLNPEILNFLSLTTAKFRYYK